MISQRNRSYNGRAMYNSSSSVNGNGTPAQNGTNGTTNNERSNGKPATATSNGKHRSSNGGKNGKMPQPLNGGCNGINDGSGPSTSDETNGGNNGRETALAARPRNGFGLLNGTSNSSDDMSSSTLQQCHANGRKGGKSCIGNTIKEHVNGKECNIEKTDCSSSETESGSGEWERLAILKAADIEATVKGKPKMYSVIIKVLPSDDSDRYQVKHKFRQLLKFSKEVQVYMKIIKCMFIFDEKRYTSACIEPPVPKLFFAELDALNDCLVIENLEQDGFVKYEKKFPGVKMLSDLDHCRVVLRSLAHLHAYSTIIQRDSEEPLIELWPFAVEASSFQELFRDKMITVKEQVFDYLASRPNSVVPQQTQDKIEHIIQELFWKLVELRLPPENERMTVLVHGCADLSNIHFSYDQYSGRPNQAKLTDLSSVCVSSPVVDLGYFLYSSVDPTLISTHYVALLQAYHHAHLEAIKGFGMHGYEIEFETLVQEYQKRIHYGAMWACLVRPALYIIQRVCPKTKLSNPADIDKQDSTSDLRIDKSSIPMDIKLSAYLAKISQVCPCPCAYTAAHSVTRDIATDILQKKEILRDLKNNALELANGKTKFKGLDCNRGTKTAMKRVLLQIAESINEEGETEESETPEDIKTKAKEKEKSKGQSKKDKSKEKEKDKDKDKDKEKAGSKDSKEKDKEKSGKEKDNKTEKETSPKKKSFSDKDKGDKGSKLDKFRYKHKTPSAPPLKQ